MSKIKPASGSFLDAIVGIPAIAREYYGDDKEIKPNDHCVWHDAFFRYGILEGSV